MRPNTLFAGTAAAVVLAAMLAAGPAEAAKRKRVERRAIPQIVVRPQGTQYVIIEPGQPIRRYFIAERRSYLDAGTEVQPGERKFTDYVFPPAYTPTANIDVFSPSGSYRRQPLSDPWDLPGFDKQP